MSALAGRLAGLPRGIPALGAVLAGYAATTLFAPWLAPHSPLHQALLLRLRPPLYRAPSGTIYWLGTDDLGRDVLSRIIFGARASLSVAALSVTTSLLVGTPLGLLAGWFGRWPAAIIMRIVDSVLSIPTILLAVLTVAVLGPGFIDLILVLGLTRWPRYTRLAYAQTLQLVTRPFIRAAELAGARSGRILSRHVLPNIAGPLLVLATTEFGLMILFEAGLSFLGLGIQPPTPSWGSIMSDGRQYVSRAWWMTVFPGICLFGLVLTVNLLGDRLRDHLDPRSSRP